MGPEQGEANDGVPWCYYFCLPALALFWMALTLQSPLLFFLKYLFGCKKENELVVQFGWKILFYTMHFSWELLAWLKFLLWLTTYYLLTSFEFIICGSYSIFLSVYGNEHFNCSSLHRRSTRKLRRHSLIVPMAAVNEIFMVLCCIRIHADRAHYFVHTILDNYLLFPNWRYATYKIFSSVWVTWGDLKPPWPPYGLLSKSIGCAAICAAYGGMFTYLSLLAPIKIFLWFAEYIQEEFFYDCNEFKRHEEYFFECKSFEDDPVHSVIKSECFVILPEYKSTYLTALQN